MADNNVDKLKMKESLQMKLKNEGAEKSANMEEEKRSEVSAVASGTKRKYEEEGSSSKPKIMMNFAGSAKKTSPISLSFNKQGIEKKSKEKQGESLLKKQTGSVAAAFAADGSDEEEEMPKEAKMRMKNLGKDTVTSAGPNSFNKGRKGFVDHLKVWEKTMKLERPTASKIRDKT